MCKFVIACAEVQKIAVSFGKEKNEEVLIEDSNKALMNTFHGPENERRVRIMLLTIILPEHNEFHYGLSLKC